MALDEKRGQLLAELASRKGAQDRLAWLVARARQQPQLDESMKTEAHLVPGCLSKLWLVAESIGGRCHFRCDSDSQIVKAIGGLLCELYSGEKPEEILGQPPDFLAQVGINQHLTVNRRNALSKIWDQICAFAERELNMKGGS